MYARVLYYTKIISKRKFKIQNIKLSKIFLRMVHVIVVVHHCASEHNTCAMNCAHRLPDHLLWAHGSVAHM